METIKKLLKPWALILFALVVVIVTFGVTTSEVTDTSGCGSGVETTKEDQTLDENSNIEEDVAEDYTDSDEEMDIKAQSLTGKSKCDLTGNDVSSPIKGDNSLGKVLTFAAEGNDIYVRLLSTTDLDKKTYIGENIGTVKKFRFKLGYEYWKWEEITAFCNPYAGYVEAIARMTTYSKLEKKNQTNLYRIFSKSGDWDKPTFKLIQHMQVADFVISYNPFIKKLELFGKNNEGYLTAWRMNKNNLWGPILNSSKYKIASKSYPTYQKLYSNNKFIDYITILLVRGEDDYLTQYILYNKAKPTKDGNLIYNAISFDVKIKSAPVFGYGYFFARDENNHLLRIKPKDDFGTPEYLLSEEKILGTPVPLHSGIPMIKKYDYIFAVGNDLRFILFDNDLKLLSKDILTDSYCITKEEAASLSADDLGYYFNLCLAVMPKKPEYETDSLKLMESPVGTYFNGYYILNSFKRKFGKDSIVTIFKKNDSSYKGWFINITENDMPYFAPITKDVLSSSE